jgi:hypothetical protein
VLGVDLVGLERGQPLQAHVEDRLRLGVREPEPLDEAGARGVGIGRSPDQGDHLVEVVERDEQPLEDVGAGLRAAQLVLGPAGDDLALVADVVADQLLEAERPRHAVDEGDHVDPERGLHLCVLVELVEDDLRRIAAPLELDHQPHPRAIGLVAKVRDPGDLLVADEVGDLLDQAPVAALLDHERELGDDDRLLAAPQRLDVRLGADLDRAAPGRVGVADSPGAHDRPAAREVRAPDMPHQPRQIDVGVGDVGLRGGDRLAQVVGRDVGRHPDRDPGGAIDEQVREPGRKHERLLL